MQNAECRIQKVREECCHEKLSVYNYPDLISSGLKLNLVMIVVAILTLKGYLRAFLLRRDVRAQTPSEVPDNQSVFFGQPFVVVLIHHAQYVLR